MKRVVSAFLSIVLLAFLLPVNALAVEDNQKQSEVIYFEDGSYLTVQLSELDTRASGSKSGKRTYTYHTNDGVSQWDAVLYGTFSYTGSSSTCTDSSCSVTIYKSDWYTISKSAGKSGNTATASVTMGRRLLGVTVDKVPISLELSCDANGNLY